MRTRTLLLAGTLMATFQASQAQGPGEIHGKVLDEQHQPLPYTNVTVQLADGIIADETDSTGHFVLKPIRAGVYTLKVNAMTYAVYELQRVEVQPDRITRVEDIVLEANATILPGARVRPKIYHPPLIDIDHPERLTVLAAQIKNDPNRSNPVKMISNISPGVYKSPNSDELYFRGSRSENMAYYVDGVKVTSGLRGVASSSIASVSVYTGGLPAKYGDVTGGVVAIETKSFSELWLERQVAEEQRAAADYAP